MPGAGAEEPVAFGVSENDQGAAELQESAQLAGAGAILGRVAG